MKKYFLMLLMLLASFSSFASGNDIIFTTSKLSVRNEARVNVNTFTTVSTKIDLHIDGKISEVYADGDIKYVGDIVLDILSGKNARNIILSNNIMEIHAGSHIIYFMSSDIDRKLLSAGISSISLCYDSGLAFLLITYTDGSTKLYR